VGAEQAEGHHPQTGLSTPPIRRQGKGGIGVNWLERGVRGPGGLWLYYAADGVSKALWAVPRDYNAAEIARIERFTHFVTEEATHGNTSD
jgi:hypothetical protein